MTRWLQAAKQGSGAGAGHSAPATVKPKPVLSVLSVLSEGVRADIPPAQIVPLSNANEVARAILAEIDKCPDGDRAAIDGCLARYRDAIALLEEQMPVRKIHIDNLVKYKMMWGPSDG